MECPFKVGDEVTLVSPANWWGPAEGWRRAVFGRGHKQRFRGPEFGKVYVVQETCLIECALTGLPLPVLGFAEFPRLYAHHKFRKVIKPKAEQSESSASKMWDWVNQPATYEEPKITEKEKT